MFELIIFIFIIRRIGHLAIRKGQRPALWKLFTLIAWIVAECIGWLLAVSLFGGTNLVAVGSIALFSAFGGYLFIRYLLEKMPDQIDEDIERIGVDDLKPPTNK